MHAHAIAHTVLLMLLLQVSITHCPARKGRKILLAKYYVIIIIIYTIMSYIIM